MNNKFVYLVIITILVSLIPSSFFSIGLIDIDLFKMMLLLTGYAFLMAVFKKDANTDT